MKLAIRSKISAKEMQVYWDRFFSDPDYRENLKQRIMDGEAPAMEQFLMTMVYGKPKETIKLQGTGDGVFILQIGDSAQAHVVEQGEARIIEGTAKEILEALPAHEDIEIGAAEDEAEIR